MKKRILACLLALCMIVAILPISAFAASKFNDTESHWGQAAIDRWASVKVLNGYPDGSFQPDKNMTRAEFAKMLCNLMGYKAPTTENPFADVNAGDWKGSSILKLYEAGVTNGAGRNSEGKRIAAPNSPITRQEAATMLGRALKIKPTGTPTFKDAGQIASWAKGYVAVLQANKWVQGVGGGNFAPTSYITRAQAAKMLGNIVTKYVTNSDEAVEITEADVKGVVVVAGKATVKFTSTAKTAFPVIVAPKSAQATVEFEEDSEASNVVVMGNGTTVTGTGDVESVEVTKEAAGTITVDTPNTEVTNKPGSEATVELPGDRTLAPGETENTTLKTIAGLKPVDTAGVVPDDKMPEVTATVEETNGATTVKLAATGVPYHQNGGSPTRMGYWVGVAFEAPENATGYSYTLNGEAGSSSIDGIGDNLESGAQFTQGAAVWFNAASTTKTATFTLTWTGDGLTDEQKAEKTYTIDWSGVTIDQAYTLSVKALIANSADGENVKLSDIKSIKVGGTTYTYNDGGYDDITITAGKDDEVVVEVECIRCIATCLMYEGANDSTALKVDATAFKKGANLTADEKTATYTITVKMPAQNAMLGIGVLAACENSNESVAGLSACQANNTTMEGISFEGSDFTALENWTTVRGDEPIPAADE